MDENQSPITPPTPKAGNRNLVLIGLLILFVLGAIGAFFIFSKSKTQTPATTQSLLPTGTSGTNAEVTDRPIDTVPKEFVVEASPFKFAPSEITVKKNDTVRITLTNKEGTHDFVLDEFNVRTKQFQAGQSETIEFIADKVGSFEYYCSVGNHRQMGMVGKLIVQ